MLFRVVKKNLIVMKKSTWAFGTFKFFRLKSIENRYRVSIPSVLFKKCTVIGTVVIFLQNISIEIVIFKVPSAQLCLHEKVARDNLYISTIKSLVSLATHSLSRLDLFQTVKTLCYIADPEHISTSFLF